MAHTQILVRHVSVMNRNPWIEWKVLLLLLYILTPCDTAAFSSSPLHLCWEGKELQEKNSFLSCTSPGNEFWSQFVLFIPSSLWHGWEVWDIRLSQRKWKGSQGRTFILWASSHLSMGKFDKCQISNITFVFRMWD